MKRAPLETEPGIGVGERGLVAERRAAGAEGSNKVPHASFNAPFHDLASAIRWGGAALRCILPESDLATREARWMLEAAAVAAGRDPLFLARPELTPRVATVYRSHIARRSRGEPLSYVLGEASFRGIDIIVTPDVLIPRPETEQLVELALEHIPRDAELRLLDQGTGSGAIAVAMAIERPHVTVTAVEITASARAIAERNASRHGVSKRVRVVEGDLWPGAETGEEGEPGCVPALGGKQFDLLVANLPYVAEEAWVADDVREWEPPLALFGGKMGIELIERSVREAEKYLVPGAWMLYEIGEDQEAILTERLGGRHEPENCRLGSAHCRFEFRKDLSGRIRFMIGRA